MLARCCFSCWLASWSVVSAVDKSLSSSEGGRLIQLVVSSMVLVVFAL